MGTPSPLPRLGRALLLGALMAASGGTGVSAQNAVRPTATEPADRPASELFAVGRERLSGGDREGGLAFWEEAWEELAARGVHDPRIGIGYLEEVSARADTSRWETASEIFLWSLGAPLVEGSREALLEELERVRLLVGEESSQWMATLADSTDQRLGVELRRFWIEHDPTPSTSLNERLLEHWDRITHARRRFVYTRRAPLGTDDRGIVYLRFGEADRVVRGSLGASEVELQVRVPRDREARSRIRQYDPNPQYEVWVYDDLNDRGFTYFLFGNRDGTGPFELVDGVHELVSPTARSQASARYTPGKIPASYYLELFYYRDLSVVGGHFGRRFSELDQLWNTYTYRANAYVSASRLAPSESELDALTDRFRMQDEFDPPNPPTVPVSSEFEGRERDELVAQSIRILSDDGVPLLSIVGASGPRLGADRRAAYDGQLDVPGWAMRHTLIIRDALLEEVGRLVQPVTSLRADLSSFVIRHVPEPLHLTLTARTLLIDQDEDADTLVAGDRLPGQVHIVPGAPLDPDPDRFQMSDLLTGTLVPPDLDANALPYPLLPARTLWLRDPLRVYLEVYHTGADRDGRAVLDARFRVLPLRDDGSVDTDREVVTLEVQLTPRAGRIYRESFDMQLRDQEPGRYRLEVEMFDRIRNERRLRSAELTLVR